MTLPSHRVAERAQLGEPLRAVWRALRRIKLDGFAKAVASAWPFPVKVQVVGGLRMYVDLRSTIGRGIFATGAFDMKAIEPGLDVLEVGATFVDVGANIGFYSVLASDRVGPAGSVYSFEIDPRPLRAFRKTIAALGLDNIHLAETAVSDADAGVSILPGRDHGHTRVREAGKGVVVKAIRLDTWSQLQGLGRLDVLKIDVEGAELRVLQGARNTITRFRPLILCEASQGLASYGASPEDLLSFFAAVEYEAKWLDGVWTPTLLARPRRATGP